LGSLAAAAGTGENLRPYIGSGSRAMISQQGETLAHNGFGTRVDLLISILKTTLIPIMRNRGSSE
jgi:hypothetical protein